MTVYRRTIQYALKFVLYPKRDLIACMNGNRHPLDRKRKNSIRKSGWDYRTTAYYFITICTYQRVHLFKSSAYRQAAESRILKIPNWDKLLHVTLDCWVVMPNHVHIILFVDGSSLIVSNRFEGRTVLKPGSLGAVVATYKGQVTNRIRELNPIQPKWNVWQREYWDRIIRNKNELNATREYIRQNPIRWAEDRENLDSALNKMTYHP